MSNIRDLQTLRHEYENIEIPEELSNIINTTLTKRGVKKHYLLPVIAASIIAIFIFSINISSAFAEKFANIPGLAEVVQLLSFNKGFSDAAENGLVQNLAKSVEHNGIKFSIDNTLYDGKNLILTYSITSKESMKQLEIGDFDAKVKFIKHSSTDKNSSYVNVNYLMSMNQDLYEDLILQRTKHSFNNSDSQNYITTGTFNVALFSPHDKSISPSSVSIECHKFNYSSGKGSVSGTWNINFELDTNSILPEAKLTKLNINFHMDSLKLIIKKIELFPTVTVIPINFKLENSNKKIAFKNLRLEDESGKVIPLNNTFAMITSGGRNNYVSIADDCLSEVFFETIYYERFKHLYLKSDGFYYVRVKNGFYEAESEISKPFTIELQ